MEYCNALICVWCFFFDKKSHWEKLFQLLNLTYPSGAKSSYLRVLNWASGSYNGCIFDGSVSNDNRSTDGGSHGLFYDGRNLQRVYYKTFTDNFCLKISNISHFFSNFQGISQTDFTRYMSNNCGKIFGYITLGLIGLS